MFGLFNKKRFNPTVTPEDQDWVEKNLLWLIEVFGLERLRSRPLIEPTADIFPYTDLNNPEQFQSLFEQVCGYWELDPNEIEINFFDDFRSKQWSTWVPHANVNEPSGLYSPIYTTDVKRFKIQLAKSNLMHPQLLVAVLAHELAHVKLLGGGYLNVKAPDMEPMTDLTTMYFGFGAFTANSLQTKDINWISRSGYLPPQVVSYVNAAICHITKHDTSKYIAVLNTNTRDLFKQDIEYLQNTGHTLLNQDQIAKTDLLHQLRAKINMGFEHKRYDDVVSASHQLLEINPKDVAAFNNIGYTFLEQKKYSEAIVEFTKAIEIDPYWEYPYNNRGYCKLQLGDIEDAGFDLFHTFEMNPDNPLAWRNLGAYYLVLNDLDKALEYFEGALNRLPGTELINFYLGHVHRRLGNAELAEEYFDKSQKLNEHNYSTIEDN